jgi:histidyl-tRNA synthetase
MGKELKFRAARGVKDVLPAEIGGWQRIESHFRELFDLYGYEEIRIPVFEDTALFARGIGDATDIVEKEMYTFPDRSGHSLTLRPEGTASVVRAYLERGLCKEPHPVKVWYQGPMFRYERPQKGRQRQFHQIGAEFFGVEGPEADAELIEMLDGALRRLGLTALVTGINSLGDGKCRPAYRSALLEHLRPLAGALCENCNRRLETNPLRVLDCKAPGCRQARSGAPKIGEFLCDPCRGHFDAVQDYLNAWSVPFRIDDEMVRGLDYYTRTTFELTSARLGSQDAVAAGGRYDGLVETFGGPPTPGLGFALGMERLVLITPDQEGDGGRSGPVYIAAVGDDALKRALRWSAELRRRDIPAALDYEGRSLKSQMRRADRLLSPLVVIVGDAELKEGKAIVRNMSDKCQRDVAISGLVDELSLMHKAL